MNSTKVQNPRHKMQVALLAEPKTPLESSVSMSSSNKMCLFCAHHKALLCDWTINTLLRRSVTHARISFPHARNHERSIRRNAENEPVSRIKMADCRVLVSTGRYSYLRNEAIIRKMPNLNTSEHYTETISMSSLSLSCASRR